MIVPVPNGRRRWIEIVVAGGILAACFLAYVNLSPVPTNAKAFPLTLVGFLAVLATAIVVRALFFPASAGLADEDAQSWSFFRHIPRFAVTLVIFGGYAALLEFLGFFTASAIFLVLLTTVLGYRQPFKIGLTYFLFLLFVFSMFVALFERPLPKEFWLRAENGTASIVVATISSKR